MKIHKNSIINALMDNFDTISVYFKDPISMDEASKISFFNENSLDDFEIKYIHNTRLVINVKDMNIKNIHYVAYEKDKKIVIPHSVLDLNIFHYNGDDLGLTYTKHYSIFKVFAPTATKINLNLYRSLDHNEKTSYQMIEEKNGIWHIKIDGDLKGLYYSYNVWGNYPEFRGSRDVVDPYAYCVIGKTNRALITDFDLFKTQSNYPDFNNFKSVIYEISIRDISSLKSSGTSYNGKFKALLEKETYLNGDPNTGIKTIMSHLKELGVNTIQIMPLQDFDNDELSNDYHWGYMPRFFNTPDGWFSSNPRNDSRIKELKDVIEEFHNNGFKVILDVVYNHTSEGFYGDGIYSFNAFAPYFYYRFGNGYISNGSGCGNELRTEGYMVRKFIVDSLKFWTNFYDFDGFRFDLMGLIDLDAMTEIVNELKMLKPNILIYGEPWTGGLTPIQPTYKGMQRHKGFSVFNDDFRDAIKGAVFNHKEKGYVQTKGFMHYDRVIQGIMGSVNTFASSPLEVLNYVEVHDNNTLFDKLFFSLTESDNFYNIEDDKIYENIKTLHKLCGFIILTSQGLPVLHLGMDFMRTKNGVENSYNSPDSINGVNWELKKKNYDVFIYYKDLIDIRVKNQLFTLSSDHDVRDCLEFRRDLIPETNSHSIIYTLDKKGKMLHGFNRIMVIINPYDTELHINLKEHHWKKLFYHNNYHKDHPEEIHGEHIKIPCYSGTILVK